MVDGMREVRGVHVRAGLIVPAALVTILATGCGEIQRPCMPPGGGIGGVVTTAEAAADPCAGQPELRILSWFSQGGVKYPLRCGKRDNAQGHGGYGYLHIRYDKAADGSQGHGDPVGDPAFVKEMQATLDHGTVAPQGGGNWRYTVRYDVVKESCTGFWGFRVILAKTPAMADDRPIGIVTAFRLTQEPQYYP